MGGQVDLGSCFGRAGMWSLDGTTRSRKQFLREDFNFGLLTSSAAVRAPSIGLGSFRGSLSSVMLTAASNAADSLANLRSATLHG